MDLQNHRSTAIGRGSDPWDPLVSVRTQNGCGDGDVRYLLHEDGEEQRVDDQHEEPRHQPLARLEPPHESMSFTCTM